MFENLLQQSPWKISLPEISPQCVQRVKKEDFKLIRDNRSGRSVYAKIYSKKSGKVKCRISQGSYKNVIGLEELVDEKFEGSCILRIYQAYVGSFKSISLSVKEILARKIGIRESTSQMKLMKVMRRVMRKTNHIHPQNTTYREDK